MGEGPLVCLQPRVDLPAHVRYLPERVVGGVEGEVVAGGVEKGERVLDQGGQLLPRALRLEVHPEQTLLDPAAELTNTIARGRGALGEGTCAPERLAALAYIEQGLDE